MRNSHQTSRVNPRLMSVSCFIRIGEIALDILNTMKVQEERFINLLSEGRKDSMHRSDKKRMLLLYDDINDILDNYKDKF